MSDDLLDTVKLVGGALALLILLVVILGPIGGLLLDAATVQESFEPTAGESYEIGGESDIPDGFDVAATTGYGVALSDGAYVDGIDGSETFNESWTVLATAAIDPAYENATMDIFGHDNASVLVQYQEGDWAAEYADDGEWAQASIEAADPANLTALAVTWDGTELAIDDGETSDGDTLSDDRDPRGVAIGFEGTLDEVRTLGYDAPGTAIDAYLADPIDPLADETHDARLMFDEGAGDTTTVYYADGEATLVGGEWTADGVPDPGLVQGVDYDVSTEPLEVTPLVDGYLDGAPVAWYSWDGSFWGDVGVEIISIGGVALGLIALALVVIVAARIMDEFNGGSFGKRG